MNIETVITAGDRRQTPNFMVWAQEQSSNQGSTSGSFEDALRQAMARAK